MQYPDYLVHFNKNHSAKNGQFVSGDGDGDGVSNDHAHRKKTYGEKVVTTVQKTNSSIKKWYNNLSTYQKISMGLGAITAIGAGAIAAATFIGDHAENGKKILTGGMSDALEIPTIDVPKFDRQDFDRRWNDLQKKQEQIYSNAAKDDRYWYPADDYV